MLEQEERARATRSIRIRGGAMERGEKRQCIRCDCLFYDLGKPEAECPRCHSVITPLASTEAKESTLKEEPSISDFDKTNTHEEGEAMEREEREEIAEVIDEEFFQGEFSSDPLYLVEYFDEDEEKVI